MEIGTIIQSLIGKNRDAENNTLQHQTQMIENDDIQTIEQQHIPGFQYNPPIDSRGFIGRISSAWKIMLGIFDFVGRISLNPGEIILYSSNSGSVAASIKLNADGSIDITAPSGINVNNDILMNGKDIKDIGSAGTDYSTHGHEQPNDSDGDSEQKTNAPS